jgi:outer membrane protein OmpA-like peptidoglycan-associated protein
MNHALPDVTAERLDDSNSMALEGRVTQIRYDAPIGRAALEIMRNYQASLGAKGFSTIFSCANEQCLSGDDGYYQIGWLVDSADLNYRYTEGVQYTLAKLARPEGDVYAAILVGDAKEQQPVVHVTVVEIKPMDAGKIAFVTASQMAQAIGQSGSVALYGIQFDFDKADIKPESKPTLDEIAKFLKANPDVSLVVAGHTDSQGGFDYNVDLSKRRAQSVANELVKTYGIAATRLTPFGAGMAAPIAPNGDDTGRAKNRRVELVKR